MQTQTHALSLTIPTASTEEQFRAYLFNRKPRLAPKSIDLAVQHLRVFAAWHTDKFNTSFQAQDITNYDMHLYRVHSLEKEKVAARTWNSRLWALGLFCQCFSMPELMDGIEHKAVGRASTAHRSLTKDEYHRLMRKLSWISEVRHSDTTFAFHNNLRICAEFMLMIQAGLRVGEVVSIEVGDITINQRSGEVLVRNGKGSKERVVQLNSAARIAVSAWLEVNDFTDCDRLFGQRVERSVQRDVETIMTSIGMPDITCHCLRYDLAKRLERIGKPIEMIRDVLGHGSIEQTKRYLRSSPEDTQSALEEVM